MSYYRRRSRVHRRARLPEKWSPRKRPYFRGLRNWVGSPKLQFRSRYDRRRPHQNRPLYRSKSRICKFGHDPCTCSEDRARHHSFSGSDISIPRAWSPYQKEREISHRDPYDTYRNRHRTMRREVTVEEYDHHDRPCIPPYPDRYVRRRRRPRVRIPKGEPYLPPYEYIEPILEEPYLHDEVIDLPLMLPLRSYLSPERTFVIGKGPPGGGNMAARRYNRPYTRFLYLGYANLLLGILIMIMGLFDIAWTAAKYEDGRCQFDTQDNMDPCSSNHIYTYVAAPIWGGLFVIIVGAVGLWMSPGRLIANSWMYYLFTGASFIVLILVCPCIIILSALELALNQDKFFTAVGGLESADNVKLAMPMVVAILGFLEWIVAIASCSVACCCRPRDLDDDNILIEEHSYRDDYPPPRPRYREPSPPPRRAMVPAISSGPMYPKFGPAMYGGPRSYTYGMRGPAPARLPSRRRDYDEYSDYSDDYSDYTEPMRRTRSYRPSYRIRRAPVYSSFRAPARPAIMY